SSSSCNWSIGSSPDVTRFARSRRYPIFWRDNPAARSCSSGAVNRRAADSAENVVEVRAFGANGKPTRADVRHDASEHRIAAEMGDCAAVHGLEYVTLGEARRTAVARRELGGAAGTRTLDSRNARAR